MSAAANAESRIDELYRQPLAEFIGARNALAKTLSGAEAARVRKLAKPTLVPWAVNQVYWHARPAYDRLIKSGERLRKAQIAALEGRSADVRAASDAHRRAIADAVHEAERLASASGSQPGADALMRTFEALSLAVEPPEPPGRLTQPLQPAGFEALAGLPLREAGRTHGSAPTTRVGADPRVVLRQAQDDPEQSRRVGPERIAPQKTRKADRERRREEASAARRKAAEEKARAAQLKQAEAAVERAKAGEDTAREAWERAKRQVHDAETMLNRVRASRS